MLRSKKHRDNFFVCCLLLCLLTCSLPGIAQESHHPNILLIVSEDNGPHLSCYGDPNILTPVLDSLAASGIRFTNAYVTQAGCSPSRSSILTGLYPHQNGQIGLATHRYAMYGNWPNIPALLKQAGYRTGIIGKLHVNPESAFPFDFNWNDESVSGFQHRNVQKVAQVADSFMSASSQPFFLMVNYPDTHVPYLIQEEGLPKDPLQADEVTTFSAIGIDTPHSRESVAAYYNCMERLDTGIGLLMDQLKKKGKDRNTLVIYLSDHGPQLARGKMTSYEFGTKVPMIMCWPGQIAQKQVKDELVSTIDLLPTILQATGSEIPADLPGKSLFTLLKDAQVSGKWREYLFTEYTVHYPHVYFPQRTVRNHRYKLIINYLQDRPNPLYGRYLFYDRDITKEAIAAASQEVQQMYATFEHPPVAELYDLLDDPDERHNLANDPAYEAIMNELKTQLVTWRNQTHDPVADVDNLHQLTEEHDHLTQNTEDVWIVRTLDYTWKYPRYLEQRPSDQ